MYADIGIGSSMNLQAGLGLIGGQAESGIEKKFYWKLLFFTGAVFVVSTSVLSSIRYIRHFEWAPATFVLNLFLLIFGILMIVLDFPIPHPCRCLVKIRDGIYKDFLFMTRFVGRGIWYLFLATLVFSSLWEGRNTTRVIGAIFTGYLILLAIAAIAQGAYLSFKLQKVRKEILDTQRTAEHYLAPKQIGLTKVQFEAMIETVMHATDHFTDTELDYVINALSFTPENDGMVSLEEMDYWLSDDGSWLPLIV